MHYLLGEKKQTNWRKIHFNTSRLMGFLIHFSIPNLYLYNYDVFYMLRMHNIYIFQKFVLDNTVMLDTNSAPGESIAD